MCHKIVFNKIAIQGKTPRWKVNKKDIGLSRVQPLLRYLLILFDAANIYSTGYKQVHQSSQVK